MVIPPITGLNVDMRDFPDNEKAIAKVRLTITQTEYTQ
jgi:hypothetical protein